MPTKPIPIQKLKKYSHIYLAYGPDMVVRLGKNTDNDGLFSVILHTDDAIDIDINDRRNKDLELTKSTRGLCCEVFDEDGYNWDIFTNPLDAF